MIITLCGFMGVGKSTVGRYLAQMLRVKFIDLDKYIEHKHNTTISDYFASNGEEAFRREELESLSEIVDTFSNKQSLILALGGGTVTREACAKIVKERTYCIYLHSTKEELAKRLRKRTSNRPLLQGKNYQELCEYIQRLMSEREALYKLCSKCVIETEGRQINGVIDEILKRVEFEL